MTADFSQAYGFKFYFQVINKSAINYANLDLGGLGAGKFIDTTTMMSNDAKVVKVGNGSTFAIGAGTNKATTKAALASNVVTLTFAAAHGFTVGQTIVVSGFTGAFSGINGKATVASVTTSSPFTLTYALTGANVAEASVVGSVLPALKLDGTDAPIRILGLMNCAPSENEKEESFMTYDDEEQGFETSAATGLGFSWKLEGLVKYNDAAYQLYRIACKEKVRNGLMIKYARLGPVGVDEANYGYGRFTGYDETPPAGSIIKFSTGVKAYGPYETDFAD